MSASPAMRVLSAVLCWSALGCAGAQTRASTPAAESEAQAAEGGSAEAEASSPPGDAGDAGDVGDVGDVDTGAVAGEGSVSAALALAREGSLEQLSFAPPEQLVFCRWYAEPERGDYLWVRLARDPGEDGDAGPRLDIDLCRVSARAEGGYAPMPAGAHGSHCAAEPGFALWWHEGDAAVNSGPAPEPAACELELEFDAQTMRAAGSFRCAGLVEAAHGDEEAAAQPPAERASMPDEVTGSFACEVVRVPPRT